MSIGTIGIQSLRLTQIKAAFNRLALKANHHKYPLCLFIDGLDEYEGDSVNHWELAKSLVDWATSEDVKICVSSRPHAEYMQTFPGDAGYRVRLHEITAPDIRQYAEMMFRKDANFDWVSDTYYDLVKEVIHNADGVFLWAVLVIRSLLETVGHHDSILALRRRIETSPKDLDPLFEGLLSRINPSDQDKANKLFLLVSFVKSHQLDGFAHSHLPVGLNALCLACLEDLEDQGFPFILSCRRYSYGQVAQEQEELHRQLEATTSGLLELTPWGGGIKLAQPQSIFPITPSTSSIALPLSTSPSRIDAQNSCREFQNLMPPRNLLVSAWRNSSSVQVMPRMDGPTLKVIISMPSNSAARSWLVM